MKQLEKLNTKAPDEFNKKETKEKTLALLEELDELQNLLYAEGKNSVLVILQGMDASGKDGVVN
ncbi:MAG: polyphosphate kinase, partial [Bacteroidota bacterium]